MITSAIKTSTARSEMGIVVLLFDIRLPVPSQTPFQFFDLVLPNLNLVLPMLHKFLIGKISVGLLTYLFRVLSDPPLAGFDLLPDLLVHAHAGYPHYRAKFLPFALAIPPRY
ncbi:MAG: hypothetical protein ACRD2G_01645 [Terriglobia bacterium]